MWDLGDGLFFTTKIHWAKSIIKEAISMGMDSKLDNKENKDKRRLTDHSF